MRSRILICIYVALLLLPTMSHGAEEMLLDELALTAKLDKSSDYQLLDARNPEAQRLVPIAYATRYRINTTIQKGLVLVVADKDDVAVEIAKSIPTDIGRSVYAVKGGEEVWKRVSTKTAVPTSVSGSFVIPMNTCEQGKPLQQLKRNTPLQQFHNK